MSSPGAAVGSALGRDDGDPHDHLGWRAVLDALAERLSSAVSRSRRLELDASLAIGWARSPDDAADDLQRIVRSHDEVDGLEAALGRAGAAGIGGELRDVVDLAPMLDEAAAGVALDLPTLAAVGDLLAAVAALHDLVDFAAIDPGARALVAVLGDARPRPDLLARLRGAIARDDMDGSIGLRDDASPALAAARRRVRSLRRELVARAEAIVRGPDLADALADKFWTEREGRIVLPIAASALARSPVATGIIHDESSRGHTVFVEPPALVEDNNRLRSAQMVERAEVRRVIEALSRAVADETSALRAGLDAIVRFDFVAARLSLSRDLNGTRPELAVPAPGRALRLPNARHPAMVLAKRGIVPNDLEIGIGQVLVVSGPNAGGKTVALTTVGLCVLLARAGVRVPADPGATIPLYRHLVTDVGDDQSIARNLSTFTAHLQHVARALDRAAHDGTGTLVLLDEVAVGTDPQQGAALAESVLRALADAGATAMVTTHYERLKLLAASDARFVNAAVGFDLEALAPTFELRIGVPGSSSAIAVARRIGLPSAVLDAAEAILDDDGRRVDVLLAQIEAERARMAETRRRLQDEMSELQRERARLFARDRRELEAAEQRRAKAHRAAASELHRLEDELRRRRKRLADTAAAEDEHTSARAATALARGDLSRTADPLVPETSAPPAELRVGDRVRIGDQKAIGAVVAIKGRRVTVQLVHAKVTVDRKQVAIASPPRSEPAPRVPPMRDREAARHFGADPKPVDPSFDQIEDLRGHDVDEAITRMEVFLDRAIAADREVVVLRHGHGSGALRRVVREHLPRLAHVLAHRPGLPPEGGDAVTVVWVRG